MTEIVLINPRFEGSYWGLEYALPLFGKRGQLAGGLLAAALGTHSAGIHGHPAYWRHHPLSRLIAYISTLVRCAVLYQRLVRHVEDPALRQLYRTRLAKLWKVRREPAALFVYLIKCAMHYHYHRIIAEMTQPERATINTF